MTDSNTNDTPAQCAWYKHKPVWIMLLLGFSAGVPLYLVFGSLSLWLREAGVDRSTVTYFSWAVLGYSFKFIWAPLVDRLPLPVLTRMLGRRRGWLLLAQLSVIASILLMANSDPADSLTMVAIGAVLLGFSSATQDVVIDAYRIEAAIPRLQALLSSTYVAGYRVGMMVAGAWALFLAESLGSTKDNYLYEAWQTTYFIMALVMLVGVITTLSIKEPVAKHSAESHYGVGDHVKFFIVFMISIIMLIGVYVAIPRAPSLDIKALDTIFAFIYEALHLLIGLLAAFIVALVSVKKGVVNKALVHEGYVAPFLDFFHRYQKVAIWILLLVGFYRVSDIVLGVITNVFYQDMGYSKSQIASITKVFGVLVTILGAMLGGLLTIRIGVMRSLALGAVLVAITNLLFLWLVHIGENHSVISLNWPFAAGISIDFPKELFVVILVDNLAQGFAIAAFLGWLASLTNIEFSATQYAVFSSAMTLMPKLLGGYSGTIVESIGYSYFFLFASLLGVPVIWLVFEVSKRLNQSKQSV